MTIEQEINKRVYKIYEKIKEGIVPKIPDPTIDHLIKVDASGGLLDAGIAITKLTKAEYDALATKDINTIYLVDATEEINNGVYIYYTDGSLSNYDTLDTGKTPLGVGLKTEAVSLVIHANEGVNKQYTANGGNPFVYDGVTTVTDLELAKIDYKGKENTIAASLYNKVGTAFTFVTDLGADWYLPACGELEQIRLNIANINTALGLISGTTIDFDNNFYVSSTQYDNLYNWDWARTIRNYTKLSKYTPYNCRAVSKLIMPTVYKLYLGSILIADSSLPNEIETLLASI